MTIEVNYLKMIRKNHEENAVTILITYKIPIIFEIVNLS